MYQRHGNITVQGQSYTRDGSGFSIKSLQHFFGYCSRMSSALFCKRITLLKYIPRRRLFIAGLNFCKVVVHLVLRMFGGIHDYNSSIHSSVTLVHRKLPRSVYTTYIRHFQSFLLRDVHTSSNKVALMIASFAF